jgi:hypothetical protein
MDELTVSEDSEKFENQILQLKGLSKGAFSRDLEWKLRLSVSEIKNMSQ